MYEQILALRNGTLSPEERAAVATPMASGFYTTAVLEAAERSLTEGQKMSSGATLGKVVNLKEMVCGQIGEAAAREYNL
jgi:hypothetical protein